MCGQKSVSRDLAPTEFPPHKFDVEIHENVRRLRRFRNFLVPRLIADGSVTVLCDRNRPQSEGFQKPLRPRLGLSQTGCRLIVAYIDYQEKNTLRGRNGLAVAMFQNLIIT